MAPEMDDLSIPKTNRVDIWSLGCILYRMVAGSPLFNNRRDVLRYADEASSPPSVVKKTDFGILCVNFLRDILQPSPGSRPSAKGCLKTDWIMSGGPGFGGCIGSDIHRRLFKIGLEAPDVDSLSHMVADGEAHRTPAKTWSTRSSGGWLTGLTGRWP